MARPVAVFLVGVWLSMSSVALSRGVESSVSARLDSVISHHAASGGFSGAALVADSSGVVLEQGYGFANLEWNIPNTPDTRFRIGSISKQFTAALVVKLVEQGKVSLDSKLSDVLPWYRADTGSKVTIRQLLNHTSGIDRSGVPRMIREHACSPMPLRDEVVEYCSGDLEWVPGSQFAYNNAGYLILGAVVEELSGLSYAEALQTILLEPVGMENTGLYDPSAVLPRRASGYDVTDEGVRLPKFVDATLASAAGGVYSTVGDLYRWDRALESNLFLSERGRRLLFTPGLGEYAMGWFVMSMPVGPGMDHRTVIRHPGQGDGFQSIFWRIPEDGVTIILINNVGRPSLSDIAEELLAVLYGGGS
jgi:CubicO group peptidase (beta-lactamase class C family)